MKWWLIFERTTVQQSPGSVATSGLFTGSRESGPEYRGFKPLLITEAPDWKGALENAVKQTRRLGEFAAVECEVFAPDLLTVTDDTGGTDK